MKKYISFALVMVLTVFSFGRLASAEDATGAAPQALPTSEVKTTPASMPLGVRQQLEIQREILKKEFEAKRDAFKTELEAKRESFKTELEAKKKEFQASLKLDRDAFKSKIETERADFKKNIKEKRGEFRGKAKEILGDRFEGAVKEITNLQNRVSERIIKVKALGKDTSKAEVYLADSKQKLADAQAKLAEIKALVPATDDKVTVENWEKIKTGANDVKNLIKESHQDLVEAVKVLKGLGKVENSEGSTGNASSSTTSATSTTPASTSNQ